MVNIHLYFSDIRNETRILKETKSIVQNKIADEVIILGRWEKDLPKEELIDAHRKIVRLDIKKFKLFGFLPIPGSLLLHFYYKAYRFLKKHKPDILNIHMLLLLPLGAYYKKKNNTYLVYDAHELETETKHLKGLKKKINKNIERKYIYKNDIVFVVGESIADWYANEYKMPRPPVVLNAPNKRELETNNHFREQLNIRKDQIILLYQGGLAQVRGVHLILDAFKARNDDKVVVVFMGYGELEADIKNAANKHDNIYFFPAVPPDEVLEYTSSADMGISLIENICLSYYYCMPNKVFEYAMAGLPVLVSDMKDMSELILNNNMGTVISDFSVNGINKALDDFLSQDLSNMKANAYRVACENAWEIQEQKMIQTYKDLLRK